MAISYGQGSVSGGKTDVGSTGASLEFANSISLSSDSLAENCEELRYSSSSSITVSLLSTVCLDATFFFFLGGSTDPLSLWYRFISKFKCLKILSRTMLQSWAFA